MALEIFDDDLESALFGENNLEKVILYDCLRTKRRRLSAARHGTFNLASMDEEDVQDEVFAIGLRRLAYPNRLCDIELMFDHHSLTLSIVSNQVHRAIVHTFGHLLRDLTAHSWLNPEQLDVFAEAVHNQGALLTNCWGIINGTARAVCRPMWHQRKFFSGQKWYPCTKYQAVMCPNGIIARLDGPYEGCRHDAGILGESGLYTDLEVLMNPNPFVLYGDPAYPHPELLQHPFWGVSLTVGQATFNYQMSRVRL
ncbi:hypothetical protein ISCGN_007005 [Ixodes scapularis]